jgi:hypothetical protein
MSFVKKKFIIVKCGKNIFYHFICANICSSEEIELWRVILALIGAGAMVSYFCHHLDQVGALLPLFNLHGLHFVFRQ